MRPPRYALLFGLIAIAGGRAAAQGPAQTLSYTATNDEFLNPERGFMKFTVLTDPWSYSQVRSQGSSIVYGGVVASAFRNQPLSSPFLQQIQNGFNAARQNGIKVKFRLAYNNDGGADAPKSVILGHIQQLAPLWQANKDVLFHMDAGFIGGWGEWHSSTNGNDTAANRAEILGAILDALPVDRTVGIRTPHFKRQIFNGSVSSDANVVNEANSFDGSDLSRVGHLNDCFLSSPNDLGTYVTPGWTLARELAYIGGESRYLPHGGETCARHPRNDSANAIAEMTTLHSDYLNIDYHPDVINNWSATGALPEIRRRLGYRFELDQATLPAAVRPGGLMPLGFTIDNVGFGELFNPRDVEVVLRNNVTGQTFNAPLAVDPRRWTGGETNTIETLLSLPSGLPEGTYTVGLWMPDHEASLRNDVRYAIRFANAGVWDAATGVNRLTTSLVVSAATSGPLVAGAAFGEVTNLASLLLAGDYNRDGAVNAADYVVWRDTLGQSVAPFAGADGDGDGQVGAGDYAAWQGNYGAALPTAPATAVPEPGSALLGAIAGATLARVTGRRR
ncbi:MAG: DUF4832 domain-containing protein [Lacipirellulaceae bacterium]